MTTIINILAILFIVQTLVAGVLWGSLVFTRTGRKLLGVLFVGAATFLNAYLEHSRTRRDWIRPRLVTLVWVLCAWAARCLEHNPWQFVAKNQERLAKAMGWKSVGVEVGPGKTYSWVCPVCSTRCYDQDICPCTWDRNLV